MSFVGSNILAGASGQGGGGYEIERSLRFNKDDSSYLNRTFSAGNRKTWTWSSWIKLSSLSGRRFLFSNITPALNGHANLYFEFDSTHFLRVGEWNSTWSWRLETEALFRDPSAWYHIVVAIDTKQSTASNRAKIYINGVEQTLSTSDYPSQNSDTYINQESEHRINSCNDNSSFSDFYYADVQFIDGQALAPTYFGEFDDDNVWQPKEFDGTYSPLVDQSQTWSSGMKTTTTANASYSTTGRTSTFPDSLASTIPFDADLNNYLYSQTGGPTTWFYIEFATALTNVTSIVFSTEYACPNGVIKLNGTDVAVDKSGLELGFVEVTVTGTIPTSLTEIAVQGNIGSARLKYVKINDKYLIDPGVTVNSNSFHLDFADNSSNAALGTDTSGNSNTWTVNNLVAAPAGLTTANQGFNVVTYTGTGSSQSISGLAFQPDFVWIKNRSSALNHHILDSVRGAQNVICSNTNDAEFSSSGSLTSFNSNGFTVGSNSNVNGNGNSIVAWCWKAGGAASSNTYGTITSSVSVNASYGFSIARYTGTGANASFGHGLSTAPKYVIVKDLSSSYGWTVWHAAMTGGEYFVLNTTAGKGSSTNVWNSTVPSSSVITVGTDVGTNKSGDNYVCYSWSEIAGFSKFGSWNGNSGSTTVTFGFKPRFVLWKSESATNWHMIDSARGVDQHLYPNEPSSEANQDYYGVDFTDTGITINSSYGDVNASGSTYLYMAFADKPDQSVIDSLVDTPTNGTASTGGDAGGVTVGNYATWNALTGNTTLSNGNLDSTGKSGYNQCLSTIGMSSGKYYCEITIDNANGGTGVGIGTKAEDGSFLGNTASGYLFYTNGTKRHTGVNVSYGASYTTGDIIGIAFDADGGNLYFYKNGTIQASGTAAFTGLTSGPYFFAVDQYNTTNKIAANFGQRAFAYTAPSGYKSLNTANLPEPTIADGSLYFDTKLYTGNGSTQSITGYNFSPDFVWLKSRNQSYNHYLLDQIRGAGKVLHSNNTDATQNQSDTLTSFNSDGFSLDSRTGVNSNNNTFVGWAWDAGSSNTTIAAGSLNSSVYDQSQRWRSYLALSSGASGSTVQAAASYAFNGNTSNWFEISVTSGGQAIATFNVTLSNVSTLEFWGGSNALGGNSITVTGTGIATTTITNMGGTRQSINLNSTTVSNLTFTVSSDNNLRIAGLYVNGKLLVDDDVTPPNVPSIASTVRANPSAGFSIVKYNLSGNSSQTIAHGLGDKLGMLITKATGTTNGWAIWHSSLPNNYGMAFDVSNSGASAKTWWDQSKMTSNVFNHVAGTTSSSSGGDIIAYCFSPVESYSAMGSYEGNGSADGPFIYTGFRPSWIMIRNIDNYTDLYSWWMFDSTRDPDNVVQATLKANGSDNESSQGWVDFLSNGFKIRASSGAVNLNLHTNVYIAFAENPFKSARAR